MDENKLACLPALSDCANWVTNERGDCGGRVECVEGVVLCENCRNRPTTEEQA